MYGLNRRNFLYTSAATAAGALVTPAFAQQKSQDSSAMAGGQQGAGVQGLTEPGQRKGKYLERDGARIFYQTFGEGDPILLLHGYPLSGALFARVVDTLSQKNLVVTVDHRGYGQSEAPKAPDSVEIYADDALAVLDELKLDKAAVGGMSMGGPITFAMHKKAPERFAGLILIDTAAMKASPAEAGLWNGMASWVEEKGVDPIIPFLLPQMLTGKTRQDMPEVADYLKKIMKQCSKEAAIGGAKALANRPDATAALGQIKVPTLILVGLDDPLYSFEVAQKMQMAIKGSKLHIVPDAAHAAIFEKPEDAGKAIADWAANMS